MVARWTRLPPIYRDQLRQNRSIRYQARFSMAFTFITAASDLLLIDFCHRLHIYGVHRPVKPSQSSVEKLTLKI